MSSKENLEKTNQLSSSWHQTTNPECMHPDLFSRHLLKTDFCLRMKIVKKFKYNPLFLLKMLKCFTKYYVIFVLIFSTEKKVLFGPMRNFSTAQNWEISVKKFVDSEFKIPKTIWWALSRSIMCFFIYIRSFWMVSILSFESLC